MNNPPRPPSKPLTAKRKKILDLAMAQLKKTRAQMDPNVLSKIRHIIAANPKVMKGLGLDKMPDEPEPIAPQQQTFNKPQPSTDKPVDKVAEIERKMQAIKAQKKEGEVDAKHQIAAKTQSKSVSDDEEKIDKGHNMEVLAKLMQLKPSEIENIKSILLKNKK